MNDTEKLARYEKMRRALEAEYREVCAKMDAMRGPGRTRTVTFRTLYARRQLLREWLDTYERYGLSSEGGGEAEPERRLV